MLAAATYFMLFSLSNTGNSTYINPQQIFTPIELFGTAVLSICVLVRLVDITAMGQNLEDSVSVLIVFETHTLSI